MTSNIFSKNSAIEGGIIFLDNILSSDNFLRENTFQSNKGQYGDIVGSYPTRLAFEKQLTTKTSRNLNYLNAYPGLNMDNFNLTIIDSFGQVIITNNGL